MDYLPNFIFLCLLVLGGVFFTRNILRIKRNILLGKEAGRKDQKPERWKHMVLVALGQSKMGVKPW